MTPPHYLATRDPATGTWGFTTRDRSFTGWKHQAACQRIADSIKKDERYLWLCNRCGFEFDDADAAGVDLSPECHEQAIACPRCMADNFDEAGSLTHPDDRGRPPAASV